MNRPKSMVIATVIGIMIAAVAAAAAWHFFFGSPNPRLSSASVTISPSAPSSDSASGSSSGADADSISIPNPTLPEEQLSLDSASWTVELATTPVEQTRGLSYRTDLGANNGMLFIFSSAAVQNFWMKDMHFPLDMIWILGDTVVGSAQNVPAPAPGTFLWKLPVYSSPVPVDKVLEVNAGTVAKYGIKAGDTIAVTPTQ